MVGKKRGESKRKFSSVFERIEAIDAELSKIKQMEEESYKKYDVQKNARLEPITPEKPDIKQIRPAPVLKPLEEIKPKFQKPMPKPLEVRPSKLELPELKPIKPKFPGIHFPKLKTIKPELPKPRLPELKPAKPRFPEIHLPELKTIKSEPPKIESIEIEHPLFKEILFHAKKEIPEIRPLEELRQAAKHDLKKIRIKKIKDILIITSLASVVILVLRILVPSLNYLYFILIPLVILTTILLIFYFSLASFEKKPQEKATPEQTLPEAVPKTKSVLGAPTFKTELDDVYSMIEQESPVGLKTIAERFHVSLGQAEAWVRILEGQGLVITTSPVFGQTKVSALKEQKKPAYFQEQSVATWKDIKQRKHMRSEELEPLKQKINKGEPSVTFKTTLDRFYNTIKSLDTVYLEDMAKEFDIPVSLAESWVLLLEERGLVKVKYPLFGKIEIIAKKVIE